MTAQRLVVFVDAKKDREQLKILKILHRFNYHVRKNGVI